MRLRTGITAAYAAEKLGELRQELQEPRNQADEPFLNPRSEYGEAISLKINAYLNWAQDAETGLRRLFTDTDLADAVFADRYWHIAGLHVGSPYGTRIINQEVDHQDARLAEAIETLKQWQELGERPGALLALDTNAFLQFRPYNEIPWTALAGADQVRLILTMPVLDEIEAKKQGSNARLKKRARKILPRLDRAFGDDGRVFFQIEKDGIPMSGVTLEILRDPPGHRRSSTDMDAEFLDRCEFLQSATARPVTIVTGDTGMKNRARGSLGGLKLLTLSDDYRLKELDPDDGSLGCSSGCSSIPRVQQRLTDSPRRPCAKG